MSKFTKYQAKKPKISAGPVSDDTSIVPYLVSFATCYRVLHLISGASGVSCSASGSLGFCPVGQRSVVCGSIWTQPYGGFIID